MFNFGHTHVFACYHDKGTGQLLFVTYEDFYCCQDNVQRQFASKISLSDSYSSHFVYFFFLLSPCIACLVSFFYLFHLALHAFFFFSSFFILHCMCVV
jgi:hypothetical protein